MKKPAAKPTAPTQRPLRVGEEIRHALAAVLYDISFVAPELDGVSITISQVQVSPDLRHANVFVTPLAKSEAEAAPIIKALNKHSGHFRHEVDRKVALKFSAKLKFIYDASFETAAKMEELLRNPEAGS
jgi:ribosome-binding factor A